MIVYPHTIVYYYCFVKHSSSKIIQIVFKYSNTHVLNTLVSIYLRLNTNFFFFLNNFYSQINTLKNIYILMVLYLQLYNMSKYTIYLIYMK